MGDEDAFPSLADAVSGPKKSKAKAKPMPLGVFQSVVAGGKDQSWADDVEELPTGPATSASHGPSGFREPRGYDEGGRDRSYDRDSGRSARPRQPVPNNPPYTAFLGNLPYDVREEDLREFFHPLKLRSVRLVKDRESGQSKGYGYVEFEERGDLEMAVSDGGADFKGRRVRIDVAEPKEGQRSTFDDSRTTGDWRANRPEPIQERSYAPARRDDRGPRDFGRGGPVDGPRDRYQRPGAGAGAEPRLERKPLTLLPRSATSSSPQSAEGSPVAKDAPAPAPAAPPKKKFDPFGGARPVDVTEIERKAEERLKQKEEELRKRSEEEKRKREEEEAKKAAAEAAPAPAAQEARPAASAGSWRTRETEGAGARRDGPQGGRGGGGFARGGGFGRGDGFGRGESGGRGDGGRREERGPRTEARPPARSEGGAWRRPTAAEKEAKAEEASNSNKYDLLNEGDE